MKISVITAVFNGREFIEQCISSVLSQTYPYLEYIVIDGGSKDGTSDIIRKYDGSISKWISEPDKGIYDALNKGIRMATGDVIGILHADDIYASEMVIDKVVSEMKEGNTDSCYGDLEYVSRDNTYNVIRFWKSGLYSAELLKRGWMPPHPAFFAKRELYEKFGDFDTDFRISADYELMLRFLSKHKITTRYIPQVLVKMRAGGASNRSISNIIRKSAEDYRAIRMHNIGGLGTLFLKNLSKIPQFFPRFKKKQ